MIDLEDRQVLARDIAVAHTAGARLKPACEIAGIDLRTLQRWQAAWGLVSGDRRPQAAHPVPGHALSQAERAHLLGVANEPRFATVPPARIVPMLADEGVYLASESTFSRVLKAHGQAAHRGRAKEPKAHSPPPRQNSCRPDMISNLGAIRMKDGSVRRTIQEQSGGAVVAAGERQCWLGVKRDRRFGPDIGAVA